MKRRVSSWEEMAPDSSRGLRRLGLTEYQSKAYMSLLEHGRSTASEVCNRTRIPYSKVYQVLRELEDRGWVQSNGGRPRRYEPVPPTDAIGRERRRLESDLKQIESELVMELQPVYKKLGTRERSQVLIIRSLDQASARVFDVLSRTQRELLVALLPLPDEFLSGFTPVLKGLASKGVSVRMLAVPGATDWDRLEGLEIRFRDKMFGGGIISDEREAVLILGSHESEPIILHSDHVGLVQVAKGYFEYLWRERKV